MTLVPHCLSVGPCCLLNYIWYLIPSEHYYYFYCCLYQLQGTLRVLLVLLHDFPEFLCDYHFALCDNIPSNCVQMRNLILSAFPRNMRLPDPFLKNLKVDMLADIANPPRILTNFASMIQPQSFKNVSSHLHILCITDLYALYSAGYFSGVCVAHECCHSSAMQC